MVPVLEHKQSLVEDALLDSLLEFSGHEDGSMVSIVALLSFSESLDFFAGHFPGQPVFPAFLQLVLVRLLVERKLNNPLEVIAIAKTKFTSIIRPAQQVRVVVDFRKGSTEFKAKFEIYCSDDLAANGSILFKIGQSHGF